jgi:putative colanic acid biosynthesis UDP-glucose lipid carrier transferase
MSVVGPRPHIFLIDDYYKPKMEDIREKLVKPGITGLQRK